MKVNVTNCPRCGETHSALLSGPLSNFDLPYDTFAICPINGQPILIAHVGPFEKHPPGVKENSKVTRAHDEPPAKKEESPTPSRYQWSFRGVSFDYYRLCEILELGNEAQKHALKKVIRAGRSIKSTSQDIDEAITALRRWKEMIAEDSGQTAKAGF